MVEDEYPRISADSEGIWVQDNPSESSRLCLPWDEIYAVSGYRLDLIDDIETVVTLDTSYGEYFELNEGDPGFALAVQAITERLRDLDPDWFDRLRALPLDQTLTVWQRPT